MKKKIKNYINFTLYNKREGEGGGEEQSYNRLSLTLSLFN